MSEEVKEIDLDSIDLDNIDLDDIDLSGFGEVNDNIDLPHIKISSKLFKEFLKVSKKICSSGGRDIISKATCLKFDPERTKVVAYATDFDVYAEQEFECINTENILLDPIVVQTDTLIKLCSAVPASTVIYKKDGGLFIKLYGGDMELESSTVATEKFIFSDEVERKSTIVVDEIKAVLKDFSPIVSSAVNPAEKRCIVDEDGAFANYMFAVIKSTGLTGKFDLKPKDIDVLKGLISTSEDTEIELYQTVESVKTKRCVVKGSTYKYSFLVSETQFSSTLKDKMSDVLSNAGVFVDLVQIYKLTELASELPYAIGKVSLNYSDSGITLGILTKKGGENKFDISGSTDGNPVPLGKDLIVQARLLKILLRSFSSKSSIRLAIGEEGLGVSADSYSAAIYAEK